MEVVTLGVGELMGAVIALAGIGFGMMKALFKKHEENINDKLEPIKDILHDVKKLELDQIRLDSKMAITYATKEDLVRAQEKNDRVIERIFAVLQSINDKLDSKADRDVLLRQEPRP